jgi:hypothetical protein
MSGGFFRVRNHTYFPLNVVASDGFGDVLAFSLWPSLNLGSISLNFKGYKELLFSTISLMFWKKIMVSISGHLCRSGHLFLQKACKVVEFPELFAWVGSVGK